MAQMKTHWKRKALAKYKSITLWYKKKMGFSAASKFVQGINDVVALLEQNPYMGKEEPELKAYKKNYRSFVEHRNHKIIYYVEKDTIYIADIWPNSQNPEDIDKRLK
ncbi:type II toxin-antitoxin system RelE/ParE family toxin [uncultured Parabacteroides sp.]|uniref:type II toxin-antitoxin system RelE/ParE family toxin n=1 Tax=uncultured Parabacteroides sp. TaxID=512312 RepID=UPI0026361447|nr:type II toxin-antitoxin system RelE/ParE family toxin [uncultured Parabacteroides sp.]